MRYQTFLSLQVKRSTVISNRHGIQELPKDLGSYKIRKGLKNLKTS